MKIQYASDLHLEFAKNWDFVKENPLIPAGDILLLAGDIMPFISIDLRSDFIDYLSDHFQTTYYVPGNHEYYLYDFSDKFGSFCKPIRENVFIVNNCSVIEAHTKFIFSTLWTHIDPSTQWIIQNQLNDFKVISYNGQPMTPQRYNQLHEASKAFLKNEIQQKDTAKTLVVSHHVPTLFNYDERYKNGVLNQAFAVELFDLIEPSGVDYWLYGHHHSNVDDFVIGRTTLITNQLGYVHHNEHLGFRRDAIIEL